MKNERSMIYISLISGCARNIIMLNVVRTSTSMTSYCRIERKYVKIEQIEIVSWAIAISNKNEFSSDNIRLINKDKRISIIIRFATLLTNF